jgi:hypothetical protein
MKQLCCSTYSVGEGIHSHAFVVLRWLLLLRACGDQLSTFNYCTVTRWLSNSYTGFSYKDTYIVATIASFSTCSSSTVRPAQLVKASNSHALCIWAGCWWFHRWNPATTGAREACLLYYNDSSTVTRGIEVSAYTAAIAVLTQQCTHMFIVCSYAALHCWALE